MNTSILAYTAGLVDGEGHITITNTSTGNAFSLRLGVTNTKRVVLEWLKYHWGGEVWTKHEKRKVNHNVAYRWEVYGDKAAFIIKQIKKYLILKSAQATIALELQRVKRQHNVHAGPIKTKRNVWKKMNKCRVKVQALNKRGKK